MRRLVATGAAIATALLLSTAATAAGTAPDATTGPVSSAGATTATVSGSVNPNGTATTWYVEYGRSTSYGSRTSSTSAGSDTGATSVTATLTGLQPGTSYHYRVVASSAAGTAHGADGLLTTAAAPQVVTGDASGVSGTGATLEGTVDPSGRATTWYFQYGTSTGYGSKTPAKSAGSGTAAVTVSAQLSGLATGRTYHFRLVATSDAGTSLGSDRTFTTAAPPSATTKSPSSVRDSSATLNGSVDPNGQQTNAYFEYGAGTSYGARTAVKNAGSGRGSTGISFSVSGLAAGTTYHFRLVASSSNGTATGRDQTFTTSGPPAVRTGSAAGTSTTGTTLTGAVDSRGHSTSWYFEYGLRLSYGTHTPTRKQSSSAGTRSVSETIGGLTPGTTYHFRLVASNSSGTSYGADTVVVTAGPALTLSAGFAVVSNDRPLTLSGRVASGRENETVVVYAQPFGAGSFTAIATVLTDAGGSWRLNVRPTIATVYKSTWNGNTSSRVSVAVRPAVSIRTLRLGRFATHVTAVRSLAGRTVQLQRRLADGRWRTIARTHLKRGSSAVFRPLLRKGRWTLRVAISVNQAGGGYLAGFSRAITVRRR